MFVGSVLLPVGLLYVITLPELHYGHPLTLMTRLQMVRMDCGPACTLDFAYHWFRHLRLRDDDLLFANPSLPRGQVCMQNIH